VHKFNQIVGEGCDKANINDRIRKIEDLDQLTDNDQILLNTIDADPRALWLAQTINANQTKYNPWSPDLHNAYLDHRYWPVSLSAKRTKRSHAQALEAIKEKLGLHFIPLNPPETISIRLHKARHQLRQI